VPTRILRITVLALAVTFAGGAKAPSSPRTAAPGSGTAKVGNPSLRASRSTSPGRRPDRPRPRRYPQRSVRTPFTSGTRSS